MVDPFLFLPNLHDALQAPDHRWVRCQYLLEYGLFPTPEDDALTQTAHAYCYAWEHCRNDAERRQLARAHPALAEARWLSQDAVLPQRAEVEARLLAGQDDASIATRCKLSPTVVHLFHALFFDVRPCLQAQSYILNVAIGPKVHCGLQFNDYDILLKIAGYTLGVAGVEELLAYWADPPVWPVCLAQFDDAALESLGAKLRMQAWILSLTLPADPGTAARLRTIRQVLAQVGVLANHSASAESNLPSACQAVLDYRALLTAPEVAAGKVAKPASAGADYPVGERGGLVIPCTQEREAVPA